MNTLGHDLGKHCNSSKRKHTAKGNSHARAGGGRLRGRSISDSASVRTARARGRGDRSARTRCTRCTGGSGISCSRVDGARVGVDLLSLGCAVGLDPETLGLGEFVCYQPVRGRTCGLGCLLL